MRVLIDVGHPSDVHFFRNFYKEMLLRNHEVLFTARNKEVTYKLLLAYNLEFMPYGKNYKTIFGKILGLLTLSYALYHIAKSFKPNIFLSHGSFYATHVAFIMRKPSITYEDTGNMEQILLYKYFTSAIITPDSFKGNLGSQHLRIRTTKELAYLHPKRFMPDINVLHELKVKKDQKYVLIRFVGWKASHDLGQNGILYKNKIILVNSLSKYARIFISSEDEIPEELMQYKIDISPEKLIDVMYFAHLFFGESATMTSECAIIGTPAIFVNNANLCYLQEQENKYAMIYNYSLTEEDQMKSIKKAIELINLENIKEIWHSKKSKLLSEQIDFTSFLIWFVENFPNSIQIIKENPEYQFNFR
jgi:uncharacterized protein